MWPGVSVVICTHNGARRLPKTLSHLAAQQTLQGIEWEVIVVDNASTDETSIVAESSWLRNPPAPLRVAHEPRLGLSNARHKGIEESKYEIVSFVDDDNWICPEWVQTISEIMRDAPDVGACGGKVEAVCEEDPPSWFGEYARDYAVGPQAEGTGDVTFTRGYLWGAGLSIRKSAWRHLRQIGFKSLLVGRQGQSLTSGEDSELCFALRLAGWRLWYDERLKLQHYIPSNRLKWNYLRRLHRGFGAATVGLEPYSEYMLSPGSGTIQQFRDTWQWKAAGTLKVLLRQLLNVRLVDGLGEGSAQIIKLEWTWGRLIKLLKARGGYNKSMLAVREMSNRHDLRRLRIQQP